MFACLWGPHEGRVARGCVATPWRVRRVGTVWCCELPSPCFSQLTEDRDTPIIPNGSPSELVTGGRSKLTGGVSGVCFVAAGTPSSANVLLLWLAGCVGLTIKLSVARVLQLQASLHSCAGCNACMAADSGVLRVLGAGVWVPPHAAMLAGWAASAPRWDGQSICTTVLSGRQWVYIGGRVHGHKQALLPPGPASQWDGGDCHVSTLYQILSSYEIL
jgi:hypothetical protein